LSVAASFLHAFSATNARAMKMNDLSCFILLLFYEDSKCASIIALEQNILPPTAYKFLDPSCRKTSSYNQRLIFGRLSAWFLPGH
jgi:hypothetical protein